MPDEKLVSAITAQIMAILAEREGALAPEPVRADDKAVDITSAQARDEVLIASPEDAEALERMKMKTTARIGVGRAGARLNTRTLLTLRADHAAARDAVFTDVPQELLDSLGLFSVRTSCADKNEFLTRPDLGRRFDPDAEQTIKSKCVSGADVQIIAADGLSSTAVTANLPKLLPVLTDAFAGRSISVGTPFFVKYGRVGAEDRISELLSPKVVCILLGERPGLATAESMSAYIVYNARVGQAEARRTVVSNIHKNGIAAAEAGAYIAELIEKILKAGKSGVELNS